MEGGVSGGLIIKGEGINLLIARLCHYDYRYRISANLTPCNRLIIITFLNVYNRKRLARQTSNMRVVELLRLEPGKRRSIQRNTEQCSIR